jgi:hypothetical protein
LVELETVNLLVQIVGVSAAAIATVVGVRSYILSNKRAQETKDRELETRQAQLFMQIYDRWTFDIGEKFWDFLEVDIKTAEEYMDKIKTDKKYARQTAILSRYHEGVGVLVRFGLLDIKYIAYLASWPTRVYWEKLKPIVGEVRRLQNAPRADSESEYLYNRLMEYIGEHPELKT